MKKKWKKVVGYYNTFLFITCWKLKPLLPIWREASVLNRQLLKTADNDCTARVIIFTMPVSEFVLMIFSLSLFSPGSRGYKCSLAVSWLCVMCPDVLAECAGVTVNDRHSVNWTSKKQKKNKKTLNLADTGTDEPATFSATSVYW